MKQIERFRPATLTGKCTSYNAPMLQDDNGEYVRYESHREILRGVGAELEALKAMQKSDFFYHLKPIFEKAFEEAVSMLTQQALQTVIKVNPCDKLTAERVREIMEAQIGAGVIVIDECEMTNAESGFMTRHVLAMPEERENRDAWSLMCVKSDCKYFTAGKRYDYEIRADKMVIVQDDFVSDLAIGDQYELADEGAYWMMRALHSQGESMAIFKKNK